MQSCEETLRHLSVDNPCIILVEKGVKRADSLIVNAGEALVLCAPVSIDVTNISGADGYYEARWIAPDMDIIREYAADKPAGMEKMFHAKGLSGGFADSFARVWGLFEGDDAPEEVARHRVKELLVWLDSIGCFSYTEKEGLVTGLRRTVADEPAKDWKCAELAKGAGMSESTLRRRLRTEGHTIADIVTDVRMTLAMSMLQSTDMSVTEISFAAGYDSPSRFAARFRKRFGFPPSRIRGHVR